MDNPRPAQSRILRYRQGRMGVLAVPGSGKTWTLSRLAADLIASDSLAPGQEVLIVTLVNSAVDNFARRIADFLRPLGRGLLPRYRVRTLHGLAHDIVRERPSLVGLSENFQIVDEREADEIRDSVALAWLGREPHALDSYLAADLDENRLEWIRRERLPDLIKGIALTFLRTTKDMELSPERLSQHLDETSLPLPLAEMGLAMYRDYQRGLAYRGGVDFDDLIQLALEVLRSDPEYLLRLRQRWPFILEDEAQDSSRLQEEILRVLAGAEGNWVRVGDPNQAIYESFTTADPRFLRDFHARAQFQLDLPASGRSTRSIMALANELMRWTRQEHPVEPVRSALSPPEIEPTGPDDPQPNPPDDPSGIHLVTRPLSPTEELQAVVDSLARWLPDHPEATAAVLVPRNNRAFQVADVLRKRGLPVVDSLLRSTSATRMTAGALGNVLSYLADPGSARRLATAFQVWRRGDRDDPEAWGVAERVAALMQRCPKVEDYVDPRLDRDWLLETGLAEQHPEAYDQALRFRQVLQRWHGTVLLPVDQMVLTLAQDLFHEPAELALAHKLAVILRRFSDTHRDWRLPELTGELAVVARNERRFLGFSEEDLGFDPNRFPGQVVVATMHKAKGLEWDRVYLMAVNNYNFPSGGDHDRYIPEKWYLRDQLNLEAEALAQLKATLSPDEFSWYQEGDATREARWEYARERLRLLYVGITRARQELVITWNTGRQGDLLPALPLQALQGYWEQQRQPGV